MPVIETESGNSYISTRVLYHAVLLAVCVFFVYLVLPSRQYSEDGIAYLLAIEEKPAVELFFPNHLLFLFLLKAWVHLWNVAGYAGASIFPFQFAESIFGGIGVGLFFVALTYIPALSKNLSLRVLLSLGLAGSFGYWYHSTNVEGTIVSVTLLLGAYLLMYMTPYAETNRSSLLFASVAALMASLAILLSQNNIFFVPALLIGMWLLNKKSVRLKVSLVCALVLGLAVLTTYIWIAFGFGLAHSISELFSWVSKHPAHVSFGGVFNPIALPRSLYGMILSFLAIDDIGTIIKYGITGEKSIATTLDYLREYGFDLIKLGACLATTTLLFVMWFKHRGWRDKHGMLAIAWVLPYAAFNVYWLGSDVQFWVVVLPALWIIIGLVLSGMTASGIRSGRIQIALATGVALLTLTNFATRILPDHFIENNSMMQGGLALRDNTGGVGLVITPEFYWLRYFKYFEIELEGIEPVSLVELAREYDGNRERIFSDLDGRIHSELDKGNPVYLRKIFQPEDIARENRSWWAMRRHGLRRDDFLEYFNQYEPRFGWAAGGETYWIIDGVTKEKRQKDADESDTAI